MHIRVLEIEHGLNMMVVRRDLEKNDPNSSIIIWDVLTDNKLIPASGIYIYIVEAEGIGEVMGNADIFQHDIFNIITRYC